MDEFTMDDDEKSTSTPNPRNKKSKLSNRNSIPEIGIVLKQDIDEITTYYLVPTSLLMLINFIFHLCQICRRHMTVRAKKLN